MHSKWNSLCSLFVAFLHLTASGWSLLVPFDKNGLILAIKMIVNSNNYPSEGVLMCCEAQMPARLASPATTSSESNAHHPKIT
jgi:hypothetical protein